MRQSKAGAPNRSEESRTVGASGAPAKDCYRFKEAIEKGHAGRSTAGLGQGHVMTPASRPNDGASCWSSAENRLSVQRLILVPMAARTRAIAAAQATR